MQEDIRGFRLSPQQKHLWLLQKTDTMQPYRVQFSVDINGRFDRQIFNQALKVVWQHQEILRTSFRFLQGMDIPIQIINDSILDTIPLIQEYNFGDLTVQLQAENIAILFDKFSKLPLNFEQLPLVNIALVQLSIEKHKLILSLPAICADTIALKNLVKEIADTYSACLCGHKLPNGVIQYADISEIFNDLLFSEETKLGKEYWWKQDFAALTNLQLKSENKITVKTKFAPKFLVSKLEHNLKVNIAKIAYQYNTSTAKVLLTCFTILLWRLTKQPQMIVGVAHDGRNYEGLESALGLFAKYLPLICELKDNLKFSEVLQQIHELTIKNSEWQEYFSVEDIGASFLPFCFEFEHREAKYAVDELEFSIDQQYAYIDRFKIKLSGWSQDDCLGYELHYDTCLFTTDAIERLAGQFQSLLISVVTNPQAVISSLNILNDRDRQQLLVEFNNTQTSYQSDKCIQDLLTAQVEQTPDNIAVICGSQQLTYRELNAQANQLAHYLQQLGVKPEVLVGICVERSLSTVVGVLGILKAGGAYVPIEPTYPPERQAFILADSQISILLTQQHLVSSLPTEGIKTICLDTNWEDIAQQPQDNPISQTTPQNLAYVIYTSGSTGKPKGTLIPHRGLVNYLSWCTQAYTIAQGNGTLVHSPLGFDLTITSLFSPLLVGRSVELLPEHKGIETLSTALRRSSNLSLVKITPAHLELLAGQLSPETAAGCTRALIIGGENLLAKNVSFWQNFAPDTMLVNEYGPTETVVGCCVYQVTKGQQYSGSIPIGRPIANTQLYVLDENLQPVGVDEEGELYIGGDGVARGYLNRPELTAEKFIPNPFSHTPGTRLYKTGDLVRHRKDGDLEFLGRIDNQVKLRGFRIELAEIEAAILEHSNVKEAVVLLREDVPGNQRLAAYIVFDAKSPFATTELGQFLADKLPEYMIPSAFVELEILPLTTNGKVDRKTLPIPDEFRPDLEVAYVAPSTEIEKTITAVWQDVLHLEKVGIHDNFFDVGGHSLLVAQVHNQLRELLKLDLSMIELLEYPTIHSLAKYLTQEQDSALELQLVHDRTQKQKAAINRQKGLRSSR
ncbi:amino acid adenylation domain-containing protein [Nostocaceae cyanobacterium CENA357]|uniref:Amino acid adenylation domain-containing protein n=1 Tax=Atlanticothrix silvestris CENA357 TaxID=1725252 RepID=A0A8J7HFF7_9CYAN|nr:non-ribosomal peptide synthetase [Atlanticothrix silvestris]MBH8554262.1 amino acid adenylation domain-containing protein [Atlanticothrix silvestris CENA357]